MSKRKIKKQTSKKQPVKKPKSRPQYITKKELAQKQIDRKFENGLILQAKVQEYINDNDIDLTKLNMYDYLRHLSNALNLSVGMIQKVLRGLGYIK